MHDDRLIKPIRFPNLIGFLFNLDHLKTNIMSKQLGIRVIILHPSCCQSGTNVLAGRTAGVVISSDNTIPKVDAPDQWYVPLRLVARHGLGGKTEYHVEPWFPGNYQASGAEVFTSDERFPFQSLPLYDRIPPLLLSGNDEEG